MPAESRYTTVNIDLNLGFDAYDGLMFSGGKFYIVFWWKYIPLGDLYYCGGRNENEIQTRQLLQNAIAKSVELYIHKYQLQSDESSVSGPGQLPGLLNMLELLFKSAEIVLCSN